MNTEKPMTKKEYYAEISKRESWGVEQDKIPNSLWDAPAVILGILALSSLLTIAAMFFFVTRV